MSDDNKLNLLYFENTSMRGLYEVIENWQQENRKRLLSVNVQKDGENFCCIALTNPMDVWIVGPNPLSVFNSGL
jgi:hypothetical protein